MKYGSNPTSWAYFDGRQFGRPEEAGQPRVPTESPAIVEGGDRPTPDTSRCRSPLRPPYRASDCRCVSHFGTR